MDIYEKSINMLKNHLKEENRVISEKEWNNYAVEENLLSSKTIAYLYGSKFNKMCRKLIRKKNDNL